MAQDSLLLLRCWSGLSPVRFSLISLSLTTVARAHANSLNFFFISITSCSLARSLCLDSDVLARVLPDGLVEMVVVVGQKQKQLQLSQSKA